MSLEAVEFRVYTYDVWGNNQDGYEVNNVFRTEDTVILHEDMEDEEIIQALITKGIANSNVVGKITFDGDMEYTLYAMWKQNTKPAFELRRVDNG